MLEVMTKCCFVCRIEVSTNSLGGSDWGSKRDNLQWRALTPWNTINGKGDSLSWYCVEKDGQIGDHYRRLETGFQSCLAPQGGVWASHLASPHQNVKVVAGHLKVPSCSRFHNSTGTMFSPPKQKKKQHHTPSTDLNAIQKIQWRIRNRKIQF